MALVLRRLVESESPLEIGIAYLKRDSSLCSTNITAEELRQVLVGVGEAGFAIQLEGDTEPTRVQHALTYFPNGDVYFPIGGRPEVRVPLSMDNYGFPNSRKAKFAKNRRVAGLSKDTEQAYSSLFDRDDVTLNEALNAIGMAVNGSMEYDLDMLEQGNNSRNYPNRQEIVEYIERARASYKTTGEETVKGMCGQAGYLIRTVLGYHLKDPNLRYTCASSENGVAHDITVVFDTLDGNWAIINSKSPIKPYNLVPKDRLSEFGRLGL